jgi:hypothetical protein
MQNKLPKILSINGVFKDDRFDIIDVSILQIETLDSIDEYNYLIITGGDGAIRRTLKCINEKFGLLNTPFVILNPTGSFNVVSKYYKVESFKSIIERIAKNQESKITTVPIYAIDKKIFLFSAGNSGDVAHIFISEVLRFGYLQSGALRYILAVAIMLPFHLLVTPFLLFSKRRFFIFTPFGFFNKFLNIYGRIDNDIEIDLENEYNVLEFDGDISVVKKRKITIKKIGDINIVAS